MIAIVHSHVLQPKNIVIYDIRSPSRADYVGQQETKVPWLIVGTERKNIKPAIEIPRTPNREYLKRRFMWYVSDCYSLIYDYYFFEFDIELPLWNNEWNWETTELNNLFDEYVEYANFVDIENTDELQVGDVILLNTFNRIGNHLSIYIGDGKIIEQAGISVERELSDYTGNIHRFLRYESKSN
jgi:cell wall-associated NlpC family hydrolase